VGNIILKFLLFVSTTLTYKI